MKPKIIELNKNHLIYCILMVIFVQSPLCSQIIYTDIPDATPNATYPLDLNNDTIDDFIIQYGGSASSIGVICYPLNTNAYAGYYDNGTYLPWALAASTTICSSLATWYDTSNPGTMAWGTNVGQWVGETNKYLALKLVVGANTYYGWARLDVNLTSSSFTLKDYAYESNPSACIESGQIVLGTSENTAFDTFSIFPNPFNYSTTIQTIGTLKNATLTIYNSYGQKLKQFKNIKEQSFSIYRDNLPSGVYFVQLTEDNKIIAKDKLILTD